MGGGIDGEWVGERSVEGNVTTIVDVFELEGKLLGEVEMPEGFLFDPPPFIKDDMVIAVMQTGDGTPYLKRYRLVLPDSQK